MRGTGDVGSAVVHALHRAGHGVILHDAPYPAHSRRGMAFVDALFEGEAELAGLLSKRARSMADVVPMLRCRKAIPISDDAFGLVLEATRPEVLVDARMRKRERPEPQRGIAPWTIGLGPNFVAGRDMDLVVETAWGARLGEIIDQGTAAALAGDPRPIEGHSRDRFVVASRPGEFRSHLRIGDPVRAGVKVAVVDPRGNAELVRGIGERAGRIADGIVRAIADISV